MEIKELALCMRGIGKRFPGVVALDKVDLEVWRGEVHIILGENGAGKSTLMKILSGAYSKDEGAILLGGNPVEIGNPRRAQELGIATIYQEFNLIPHLSSAENVFLGREPLLYRGIVNRKAMAREASRLLERLGEAFDPLAPVKKLSVARQQMVEVAKALTMNARILIMDEPTSALTESEIQNLFTMIRHLRSGGTSIIYISHRLHELFEIGDRVTVLRDGRRIVTCPIAETTPKELVRLMVDRELSEHFPKRRVPRGEEVLRVEGLSSRGKLRDVSFTLNRGEILGISGLLGSGRTEIARAVFGADPVETGTVWVRRQPARIRAPSDAIRWGMGFITEDRKAQGLVLGLSVKHNIGLPNMDRLSRMSVVSSKSETALANEFIGKLRIKTPGAEQKALNLSGGNQQKVVLAKWLAREADILIFDEPTRGIDVGSKVDIYHLMNELTNSGVGIIMISSELPEILGMSDRILVMNQGAVAGEFDPATATQESILAAGLGQQA